MARARRTQARHSQMQARDGQIQAGQRQDIARAGRTCSAPWQTRQGTAQRLLPRPQSPPISVPAQREGSQPRLQLHSCNLVPLGSFPPCPAQPPAQPAPCSPSPWRAPSITPLTPALHTAPGTHHQPKHQAGGRLRTVRRQRQWLDLAFQVSTTCPNTFWNHLAAQDPAMLRPHRSHAGSLAVLESSTTQGQERDRG